MSYLRGIVEGVEHDWKGWNLNDILFDISLKLNC